MLSRDILIKRCDCFAIIILSFKLEGVSKKLLYIIIYIKIFFFISPCCKVLLMSTHNICFYGEIKKNIRAQLFKANDIVS